jgi:DNA-binding MarR family transcriptional regulator
MPTTTQTTTSPEIILLQRIVRLRSNFKVVMPENMSALRKQIHESALSGKGAGINDAGLFYNVGNVFSRYAGPITMGELSRDLEVPLSTATRTMDWLVNNGYARRLDDPSDRRVVRVELTEAGNKTYQAISTFMLEKVDQAMSQFSPTERELFMALLNKVLNAFEEAA